MRRIIVMGPPGSGKSTLARELGRRHKLPVFHLDQAYWQPGWIETPPDLFRAEVERMAALPAWVIDGNYVFAALAVALVAFGAINTAAVAAGAWFSGKAAPR